MDMSAPPPLLVIGGPTASGKTGLAIDVARRLGGEIINADSRQVYRGMDIGTAKPSAAQRALAPHHLLDLRRPDEDFSLAGYVQLARDTIGALHGRGVLPILTGGTGLYLRAVTQGYDVPPVPPDLALRATLEAEARADGGAALLERLVSLDPVSAARIDPRNIRRLIRALEVTLQLGRPFSDLQQQVPQYRTLFIVLQGDRAELYARADRRLEAMIAAGFADEVRALLGAGYSPESPAFSALGYREMAAHVQGTLTLAQSQEAIRYQTHAYIRRQLTWFRREREAHPMSIDGGTALSDTLALVERALLCAV
jgi:tRNA dimethylallyltransferase